MQKLPNIAVEEFFLLYFSTNLTALTVATVNACQAAFFKH
jgi:hypothetical protein